MDLKFDTLHKKPKVYNVALLSLLALAVLAALLLWGGAWRFGLAAVLLCLHLLAVAALLTRAFFLQLRYNPYSYNIMIYFGFGLYCLALGLQYLPVAWTFFREPEVASMSMLLGTMAAGAQHYMLISFPFLLVFSVALIVSNISLIRHEGFGPVNGLGFLLSLLILAGELLVFRLDYYATGSETEVMIHDILVNLLATVYLYFECMLLGTMAADAIAARHEPKPDKDFIIVLGCGLRKDGTPTPLLRGRIQRALDFARKQEAATGKAPIFILSGGQGPDEIRSEAASMAAWLEEQGVPKSKMLLEDRSANTAENMAFSKEIIQRQGPQGAKVAFSTTNYHVFRSGLKARRVKLRAVGMGCKSKWYFWPNAAVREFIGLLTGHRGKQALILLGLLLGGGIMTILSYKL